MIRGTVVLPMYSAESALGDAIVKFVRYAALAAAISCSTDAFAAPGDLDPSFGGGVQTVDYDINGDHKDEGQRIAISTDGKIYAVGTSSSNAVVAIARIRPDGMLDPTYGIGGKTHFNLPLQKIAISGAVLQADGRLVVSGTASGSGFICRLKTDGSPDETFGSGFAPGCPTFGKPLVEVKSFKIQADGKIVVLGTPQDQGALAVRRLLANGVVDDAFANPNFKPSAIAPNGGTGRDLAIAPDGVIIVAGLALTADQVSQAFVMRLTSVGAIDSSFGKLGVAYTQFAPSTKSDAWSVRTLSDGSILVSGRAEVGPFASPAWGVAKLTPKGKLDGVTFAGSGRQMHFVCDVCISTFNNGMTVQSDGRIVLAGWAALDGVTPLMTLMRLKSNGTIDESFGALGTQFVPISMNDEAAGAIATSVAIQNGRIVAAGTAWTEADPGNSDIVVVRLQN